MKCKYWYPVKANAEDPNVIAHISKMIRTVKSKCRLKSIKIPFVVENICC